MMAVSQMFFLTALTFLCLAQVLLGQQVPASLGCVHCRSNNQGECGLRTSLGQSPSTSLQQSCPLGTEYCYTYVQVSAGQEPYVRRGCGLFKCGLLPAGSQGDACDDNLEVTPPITGLVNQSRVFNSGDGHGPVAVLQYCRTQLCNAGLITDYLLPGVYVLRSAAPLTQTNIPHLILPTLLVFLLKFLSRH